MKRLLVLTILLLTNTCIGAQEFSFVLAFQDARGNVDTLILGYDAAATDSVDQIFDEFNIIEVPLDTAFDVRITNEFKSRNWHSKQGDFHLKKQIIGKHCSGWPEVIVIDIKCNHWPVTATWNNTLFDDSCREGSVFTSINPGGWWDTGSPSNLYVELWQQEEVTFRSNVGDNFNTSYAYRLEEGEIIPVYWFAFGDSSVITVPTAQYSFPEMLKLYPNPTGDFLYVENVNSANMNVLQIFNLAGQTFDISIDHNRIDIRHLPPGTYILHSFGPDDNILYSRFIKI